MSRPSHHASPASSYYSRRKRRRARRLAIALTCGIAVGMNGVPIALYSANAMGIELPQSWQEDDATLVPVSDMLNNISQANTTAQAAKILADSPLFKNSADIKKNSSKDDNSEDAENADGGNSTNNSAQLQAILNAGINRNFPTSAGTFYVPLEGRTAPSGMALVGVRGTFITASAGQTLDTAIAHINEIRKDAYKAGLVDRYVPISRSAALERTAQIRAVEATVYPGHTRPNGKSFSSIGAEGFASGNSETIAWGGRTLHAAIDQWAAEKQNYINAKNGKNTGETGHYAALIDPNNKYVGLGMFKHSSTYGTTIVGRFAGNNPAGPSGNLSGQVIQGIYVPSNTVAGSREFALNSSSIGSQAVFAATNRVFNARALIESEIKR